jgi:hypothetical protein
MMQTAESDRSSGNTRVWAAGAAVVSIASVWPYLFALPLWPTSRDGTLWILRGMPTNPDWAGWVFASRHFVGFRPVTALSYTLNHAIGGFAAPAYRLVDLALHAMCAFLVYLLYRSIAPRLAAWGGLIAAGLFAVHPVVEEVVPHLARRSYSLATGFGLAALVVLCSPKTPARPWARAGAGSGLLLLALASNEVAVVTVAMVPILVWHVSRHWTSRRSLAVVGGLPTMLGVLALVARAAFIGGVGGYASEVERTARVFPIVAATWETLTTSSMVFEGSTRWGVTWLTAVLGGVWLVVCGVVGLVRWRDPDERVPGLLLLWLVGYAVVFAPLGVWFPRQVYIVVAPFALLAGVVICQAMEAGLWSFRGARGAFVDMLCLSVLLASPVLRGANPSRVAAWRATDAMLRDGYAKIGGLTPKPRSVALAVPYFVRPEVVALRARGAGGHPPLSARQPELWLGALLADRDTAVDTLLVFEHDLAGESARPTAFAGETGPGVRIPNGVTYYTFDSHATIERTDAAEIVIPYSASDPLYLHDGTRGEIQTR